MKEPLFLRPNEIIEIPVAALVFLELNGIEVEADETGFERLVLDVAENRSSKSAVAEYLRRNSRRIKSG